MRVKVIVVPVFRRTWLYHAWTDSPPASTSSTVDWSQAHSPVDKLRMVGQSLNNKVTGMAASQWQKLQAAQEGSWQNRIYKLAQGVLSRENPAETFLKAIPKDTLQVEIIYPASLNEKLVRRRLRLLSSHGVVHHQRRLVGWSLVTLPQLPLMLTPLPNVTVYYSVYRLLSNWQAFAGATALQRAFNKLDGIQMHRLQVDHVQQRHHNSSVVQHLTAKEEEYLQRMKTKQEDAQSALLSAPTFVSSQMLDDIVQPLERWKTPLSDEVARQLVHNFSCSGLLEQLTKTRQRAMSGAAIMA